MKASEKATLEDNASIYGQVARVARQNQVRAQKRIKRLEVAKTDVTASITKLVEWQTGLNTLKNKNSDDFKGTRRKKFNHNVGQMSAATDSQIKTHHGNLMKIEAMISSLERESLVSGRQVDLYESMQRTCLRQAEEG